MRIGGLEGLGGDFDKARATIGEARAIMDDLGLHHQKLLTAPTSRYSSRCWPRTTRRRNARREHAYAVLAEMGDRTYQATEALLVAEALEGPPGAYRRGRGMARDLHRDRREPRRSGRGRRPRTASGPPRTPRRGDPARPSRARTRPRNLSAVRRRALHPRPDPDSRGPLTTRPAKLPNNAWNATRQKASSRSSRRRTLCSPRSKPRKPSRAARADDDALIPASMFKARVRQSNGPSARVTVRLGGLVCLGWLPALVSCCCL